MNDTGHTVHRPGALHQLIDLGFEACHAVCLQRGPGYSISGRHDHHSWRQRHHVDSHAMPRFTRVGYVQETKAASFEELEDAPGKLCWIDHGEIAIDDVQHPVEVAASIRELHDLDLLDARVPERLRYLPRALTVRALSLGDKDEILAGDRHVGPFKRSPTKDRMQDRHADPG